jgi:hypothetical protein
MVVALDIKDAQAMASAWYIVSHSTDYNNVNYSRTVLFKFDATWVFPTPADFENGFRTTYIDGHTPDAWYMNIMPVWQTSGIIPSGPYGNENQMLGPAASYAQNSYTAGIELNQKQPYGILWTITNWAHSGGTQKALANFNPYAEWIDPNDGYQTYRFFYSNGYCCGVPRDWFYNGAPHGQPSDTDDQRVQWPFLLDQGVGFNLITTDNVIPMDQYLRNEGKRNLSYMR